MEWNTLINFDIFRCFFVNFDIISLQMFQPPQWERVVNFFAGNPDILAFLHKIDNIIFRNTATGVLYY